MPRILLLSVFIFAAADARAQTAADTVKGVPRFPFEYSGMVLSGPPRAGVPLRDQGRFAKVDGDELGNLNVTVGGQTLVRNLSLAFGPVDSTKRIAASELASLVIKRPEGSTIVYSHAAFTVREHIFVPLNEPGAIILLDVETVVPLDVLVLSGDSIRSIFRFGAGKANEYIPITVAGGAPDSIPTIRDRLTTNVRQYWRDRVAYVRTQAADVLSIETPDPAISQAFEWAKIGIEHQQNPDVQATLAMSSIGKLGAARAVLVNPEIPATPIWMLACFEYWLASGDDTFLRELWPNISGAFKRAADRDQNGDGLIEDPAFDIHAAGVWTAALDGVQQMARAMKDASTETRAVKLAATAQRTIEREFWSPSAGVYAANAQRPHTLTSFAAAAMAFGMLDAERSERMLREMSSAALATDWGARALANEDSLFDPFDAQRGAVTPTLTGYSAVAHYRHHRAWSGFDLVQDIARMTLDFERGRTVEELSGVFYQALASAAVTANAPAMMLWPVVRGIIGWQSDPQHRAAALEPHLPPDWTVLRVTGLRAGRDRIDATVTRERGLYAISLRRRTTGPGLAVRVAPALPLGARIERIVVDDQDVVVQAEESAHDVHAVADVTLLRDAHIEFHYEGGIEVLTPSKHLAKGDATRGLNVLDFRREGRDYVLVLEGVAGSIYTLSLRSETRLRAAMGADAFEQDDETATLRVTMPPGGGFTRKTVRLRP